MSKRRSKSARFIGEFWHTTQHDPPKEPIHEVAESVSEMVRQAQDAVADGRETMRMLADERINRYQAGTRAQERLERAQKGIRLATAASERLQHGRSPEVFEALEKAVDQVARFIEESKEVRAARERPKYPRRKKRG